MCKHYLTAFVLCSVVFLTNCATTPPENIDNVCAIFEERPEWYEQAKDSEKRWGTPVYVQMSIIRQESSFRHDARPGRTQLLGFIPWTRLSSAKGYAQALDATWESYKKQAGNSFASRGDFEDAIDFVGWYTSQSQKLSGISKWNAEQQYLAYHEGQGGYNRKTYRNKPWLMQVAKQVNNRASAYSSQLRGCEKRLAANSNRFGIF